MDRPSVSSLRRVEFFASESLSSRTSGSGEILKSDRISVVEEAEAWRAGGTRADSFRTVSERCPGQSDQFYVGTMDGTVHSVRVTEEDGKLGYAVEGSFAAMKLDQMGDTMGTREVFRIGYISRLQTRGKVERSATAERVPRSSEQDAVLNTPTSPKASTSGGLGRGLGSSHASTGSPGQQSASASAIGRRLYAVLEDAVRGKQVESADELLLVVGYSRNNVVVRVWDVSRGVAGLPLVSSSPSDAPVFRPKLIAHKSVFKALKLLESEIESVAVDSSEWPKVSVAVGTASGGIYLYTCGNVDAVGSNVGGDEFSLLRSVENLKEKRGKASSKTGAKANRIQYLRCLRATGPGSTPFSLHVWGVSETGDVIGFDTRETSSGGVSTKSVDIMVLDKVPSPVKKGCVSMDESGVLCIATRDGIFCYTMEEGRTVATSIPGAEQRIAIAAGEEYLVLVSDEDSLRDLPLEDQRGSIPIGPARRVSVQIIHIGQKLIVWSMVLPGPIKVAGGHSEMGLSATSTSLMGRITLYILDGAGTVRRLSEISLSSQIDQLCEAKLFLQALGLCHREQERRRFEATGVDCDALAAEVHLLYGDFLFRRGQSDASVDAYINTIGFVETSHVIQTFLQDLGEAGQLARYLRALVGRDMATGDHISLLLQIYVDANDLSSINEVVDQLGSRRGKLAAALDAAAAVDVLRRAGFHQHALVLSKRYGHEDEYISILLDDLRAYDKVLEYLKAAPRQYAAAQILRHGRILIDHQQTTTTALLMELCTDPGPENEDRYVADLASFSALYVNRPNSKDFRSLCQQVISSSARRERTHAVDAMPLNKIYESLIDEYLMDAPVHLGEAHGVGDGVVDVLRLGWPPGHGPAYDPDIVLARCAIRGHHQGIAFIHARSRRYRDAIVALASTCDWQGVIDICHMHGRASDGGDPSLWRIALEAISDAVSRTTDPVQAIAARSASDGVSEKATKDIFANIGRLLTAIGDSGAMAPLEILETLSKIPSLPFGVVKNYFVDILRDEAASIQASSADVAFLTRDTEATVQSLNQLDARTAIFKATKDSSIGSGLHLPAIHFMCGHSFNALTGDRLGEGMGSLPGRGTRIRCPLCSDDQDRMRGLLHHSRCVRRDAFYRQIQAADDGFAFVCEKNCV